MLRTLILSIITISVVNAQTVTLSDRIGEKKVNVVNYLSDPLSTIKFSDVSSPEFSTKFKLSKQETLLNEEVKTYWIKFYLLNTDELARDWVLDLQQWSFVDFYYSEDGIAYDSTQTGHLLPYHKRDYPVANHNYITLQLKSQKEVLCYARLERTFNTAFKPTNLSFDIIPRSVVVSKTSQSRAFSYLFIGIYLVMLLYNMFIYYSTKDKVYAYYLITLFILIIAVLTGAGEIESWFSFIDNMPSFLNFSNAFLNPAISIALLLFVKYFLKVKERYPVWNKAINYLIYFIATLPVVILINFDLGMLLSGLAAIPFVVIIFTVGIKSYLENYPGSTYFVLGHLFWFLGGISAMCAQMSILPFNDFFINFALPLGSSIEMILFSLALANTINFLKEQNEIKQRRIITQLEENHELQTKVTRELEQKVVERTKLISEQNEEIKKQKQHLQLEKNRSESLLLNILPKEIAEELKSTGHATPRYFEQVSILFADIKGFSMMFEKSTPNDLVKDLDYCFSGFDYIITRHNLEKIKTIGDAYMCVGGLPVPNKTHAIDAVNAGLEMIEFMQKWQQERPILGADDFVVRLGIHSGPVVSGVVGTKKFQYDIWGHAVNLASRMETGGEAGKVNISKATYDLVKDQFNCQHRGKILIKNMGEVDMYFVEHEKALSKK